MLEKITTQTLGLLCRGLLRPLPASAVRAGAAALFARSWTRFQKACADPQGSQLAKLRQIVTRNQDTQFGREHGFSSIRDVADFQRRVPIRNYDQFEPYIDRMLQGQRQVLTCDQVGFFARTSGTTGAAKYIPVTAAFLEEYRSGRRVWARQVARSFPGLVRGALLSMQSPRVDGRTQAGIAYGALAVALSGREPGALRNLFDSLDPVPREVFLLEDFQARYYLILRLALAAELSLMAAINPSTLILLCQKLTEFAPSLIADCQRGGLNAGPLREVDLPPGLGRRLRPVPATARRMQASLAAHGRVRPIDVWPQLCGLLCWKGGSAPFYLRQFPEWFGDRPVMDYCYAATEGNFSVVLGPAGDQGVVAVGGHFLEFVPEDEFDGSRQHAQTAAELEAGRRYRVLVTASNGLYRYDINDVIEVVGRYRQTPQIVFCHKGGNVSSITGEKVSESQVVRAVSAAQARCAVGLRGFCVGVRLDQTTPGYLLAVEPDPPASPAALSALLSAFEQELQAANIEYQAKRRSQRLGAPQLVLVEAGAFERWRRERLEAGAFDSQLKLPHLVIDPAGLDRLGAIETIRS